MGEDSYVLDLSLAFNSDPSTGSYKVALSQLNLKGLCSLSGSLAVSGLTQNLLNALAQLSLRYINNLSFGDGLKDTGIDSISLVLKDDSLISKFVNFSASLNNLTSQDMVAVYKSRISDIVIARTGSYLDTASGLAELAGDFISAPDTISFSFSPGRPFSRSLIDTYGNDKAGLYNHLNMTITANNLTPVPLTFNENINPPAEIETAPTDAPSEDDASALPQDSDNEEDSANDSDNDSEETSEEETKE
jgi:hypothetical protein